jgi:basic membrane protein A and related proteins
MFVSILTVLGCGDVDKVDNASFDSLASIQPLKVHFLLAPSGEDDQSYNDSALSAVDHNEHVQVTKTLPSRPEEYGMFIERLAKRSPDLIVGVGFLYTEPFKDAGRNWPDLNFLLLDANAGELDNVRSATFDASQGSFLAGVAAAATSKSGSVAFLGGIDIPIIREFECGYRNGFTWASKESGINTEVSVSYIGTTPDAFSNPRRAQEITNRFIKQRNVDVIYHAAGGSGVGVIRAAKENNIFAIGVDTDQNHLAEYTVLTSMRKRLDKAVDQAISDVKNLEFSGGAIAMNVANGGVDIVKPGLLSKKALSLVETATGLIESGLNTGCND